MRCFDQVPEFVDSQRPAIMATVFLDVVSAHTEERIAL
jgi:hypothetical protein